jgi:hypothetical protein
MNPTAVSEYHAYTEDMDPELSERDGAVNPCRTHTGTPLTILPSRILLGFPA